MYKLSWNRDIWKLYYVKMDKYDESTCANSCECSYIRINIRIDESLPAAGSAGRRYGQRVHVHGGKLADAAPRNSLQDHIALSRPSRRELLLPESTTSAAHRHAHLHQGNYILALLWLLYTPPPPPLHWPSTRRPPLSRAPAFSSSFFFYCVAVSHRIGQARATSSRRNAICQKSIKSN